MMVQALHAEGRSATPMARTAFLPAAFAGLTDLIVAAIVRSQQPDFPLRLILFLVAMFGFSLLMATPVRWVWVLAFLLLIGGAALASASVGFLYVPTVIAAGWVMV